MIHPPVDSCTRYFSTQIDDYYLVVSRLAPYKRIDSAIEACKQSEGNRCWPDARRPLD